MFAISKPVFKANFTVKTLLEVSLFLIIYSEIYPTLIEPYLETQINNSDPATATLLSLLPFVIAAVIIIIVISWNVIGGRRR